MKRYLMVVGLLSCLMVFSGCSFSQLLTDNSVMQDKLNRLESTVENVVDASVRLEELTDKQKVEYVNAIIAAREDVTDVKQTMDEMGTNGLIGAGVYLFLRHILPRFGGPLGAVLSWVGSVAATNGRRKEDG